MTERSAYTEFRPKWYRARVSTYWWLGQWSYTKFILRELSSVFVGYFIVITLPAGSGADPRGVQLRRTAGLVE